ncbi:ATP-binding cassette domain-containing protein [Paenibacillus sp. HB172176]|uniref:ATP-binding cassette domain-containing protein n=1 Tax=Paenibacillus sp. HB172176 TaxID=2493690 RepID=UPI00143AF3E3|nr:ATP-binding cassette domain-containing protein [Paenibacillus sp. HB172176]
MADNWELRDVAVRGNDEQGMLLLSGVTVSLQAGSIILVIGHNGAGKSTLLETLAGLRELDGGEILLGHEPLWLSKSRRQMTAGKKSGDSGKQGASELASTSKSSSKRKLNRCVLLKTGIAMQHSESQWFANTVRDELRYSLRPYKLPDAEAERRMMSALREVGLQPDLLERDPWTLSGGQQRRLALACLLACEPDWLLLDEPTAGLDAEGIERLRAVLAAHRAAGRGAVVATHDLDALLPLADAVVVVADGAVREAAPAEAALSLGAAAPQAHRALALLRGQAALPPEALAGSCGAAPALSPRELAAALAPALLRQVPQRCEPPAEQSSPATDWQDQAPQTAVLSLMQDQGSIVSEQSVISEAASSQHLQPSPTRRKRLRSDWFDPRAVIASYLLLTASLLTLSTIAQTVMGVMISLLAAAPFYPLYRGKLRLIRAFAVMTIILIVFGGISLRPLQFHWESAEPVAVRMLALLCIFGLGMPLMELIAPFRLQRAIEQSLGWLAKLRVPVHVFGLLVMLVFRFIPLIMGEWGRFAKLAHARGKATGSLGALPLRQLPVILLPFLRAVLRLGEGMAEALEARGFGESGQPASYGFRLKPAKQDAVLLGSAILLSLFLLQLV